MNLFNIILTIALLFNFNVLLNGAAALSHEQLEEQGMQQAIAASLDHQKEETKRAQQEEADLKLALEQSVAQANVLPSVALSPQEVTKLKQSILDKYKSGPMCYRPAIAENIENIDDPNQSLACMVAGYKKVYYGGIDDISEINNQIKLVLKAEGVRAITLSTPPLNSLIMYRPEGEKEGLQFVKYLWENRRDQIIFQTERNDYINGFLSGYPEKDIEFYYNHLASLAAAGSKRPLTVKDEFFFKFNRDKKRTLQWLAKPENADIAQLHQWVATNEKEGHLRFIELQ